MKKVRDCVVNGCTGKRTSTNKYDMCFRHGDWLNFLLWVLPLIQIQPQVPSSGLLVPTEERAKQLLRKDLI